MTPPHRLCSFSDLQTGILSTAAANPYYTSNFDLPAFNSNFYGAGFRIAPPRGVVGISHLSMPELRYGHSTKNYGMNANIISLNLKYK